MRKAAAVLLLLATVALATPAGKQFGKDAVWHPRAGDEQKTWQDMQQCGAMMTPAGGSPGSFETCTGEAMRKHGAPEAAIAFNNATGGNAYATKYVADEFVDHVEALDPFQANSNDKLFFVNATPSVIDVDAEAMKLDANKHPQFLALKK